VRSGRAAAAGATGRFGRRAACGGAAPRGPRRSGGGGRHGAAARCVRPVRRYAAGVGAAGRGCGLPLRPAGQDRSAGRHRSTSAGAQEGPGPPAAYRCADGAASGGVRAGSGLGGARRGDGGAAGLGRFCRQGSCDGCWSPSGRREHLPRCWSPRIPGTCCVSRTTRWTRCGSRCWPGERITTWRAASPRPRLLASRGRWRCGVVTRTPSSPISPGPCPRWRGSPRRMTLRQRTGWARGWLWEGMPKPWPSWRRWSRRAPFASGAGGSSSLRPTAAAGRLMRSRLPALPPCAGR
jgi:hypothetical protein